MYCNRCGANNPDGYRYCAACGCELGPRVEPNQDVYQQNQWQAQPEAQYQQNVQYQQNPQYYQNNDYYQPAQDYGGAPNRQGDKKKTAIIIVCVAVAVYLAIMGAVGFHYISTKDSDETTKKTTSSRYDVDDEDEDEDDEKETTEKTTAAPTTTKSNKDNYGNIKPDNYYDGNTYYVNDDDGLYLRKGPGTGYDDITVLDKGVKVVVRGSNNDNRDWYYVYVESEGEYGWVNNTYLSTSRPSSSSSNSGYIRYSSSFILHVNDREGLYLRERPTTSAYYITLIPYQRSVEVLGYAASDSSWYYVRTYVDGRYQYGYCYKYYLS